MVGSSVSLWGAFKGVNKGAKPGPEDGGRVSGMFPLLKGSARSVGYVVGEGEYI